MGIVSTIQSILNPYTPVDKTRILLIDISHWSNLCDLQKAKENGASGVIIKAMDGVSLTKWFKENYQKAKDAKLPVGAYTWLYSSKVLSPGRQARAFLDLLKDYPCEIKPCVDFEKTSSGNPTLNDLWGFVKPFEDSFGKKPMIYSGPYYWRENGSTLNSWKAYDFWIANYKVNQPIQVLPWKNEYKLWQFSDRIDSYYYGGSGEKMMDGNYFNGTKEDFVNWISGKEITPAPLPPSIEIPKVYKVTTSALNIRENAGTQYKKIGSLARNSSFTVLEYVKVGNDIWAKISSGYICLRMSGQNFTSKTDYGDING